MDVDRLYRKMLVIGSRIWPIRPFPFDLNYTGALSQSDVDLLQLGVAYQYKDMLYDVLLPFRGTAPSGVDLFDLAPGIYINESSGQPELLFRLPIRDEIADYHVSAATDVRIGMVRGEYDKADFITPTVAIEDIGDDVYAPPVRSSDDFLNQVMKTAIRMKRAPFGVYGRRLRDTALDNSKQSSEASSAKGNARRALRDFQNMSATKFAMYAGIWDVDVAIVLKDRENATDRLKLPPDKTGMIFYLGGQPFDFYLDELADAGELIGQAIAETIDEPDDEPKKKRKKDEGDE